MQLSIIIVNYNVKYFLEHCLLSVIKACNNITAEILVVDNNSTDNSKEYFANRFPTVQFYWCNENLGFGKANNYALQYAKGEHILFLNPDTIVAEDCFVNCLSFFNKKTDCGAIGVRMIDGSGQFLNESKRSLPTPVGGFFKMINIASLFPQSKMFAQYYAGHLPEKENNKVDVLAGAFMMLSKKAIEITKGFDESFFMYGEDIDLSYRIQNAGLQNYYLGDNTIIHFKGESTQKKSDSYNTYFYGAIKRFVDKHYSQQWFKKSCMKLVINAGKFFASLQSKLILKNKQVTKNEFGKMIIVGTDIQIKAAKNLLVSTNSTTIDFEIQNNIDASEIVKFCEEKSASEIVLCEGILTNKTIIETTTLLPTNCTICFLETGAKSIISSNNKNDVGFIIAAPL
jgi:GT2 family glycosyltransferase